MKNTIWINILENARWAPSPHNTQPWKLKILSDKKAQLFYIPHRLLKDTDPTGMFLRSGFGIFLENLDICAQNLGKKLIYNISNIKDFKFNSSEPVLFCELSLIDFHQKPRYDVQLILNRKTARGDYNNKSIQKSTLDSFTKITEEFDSCISFTQDSKLIRWLVTINRDTVFDDMYDGRTRKEIGLWARFTRKGAMKTRDGLWSKCMGFFPVTMWSFFRFSKLFTLPGLKQLIYRIYLNKTKVTPTMAWIEGPFITHEDHIRSGIMLARLWLEMTKHDIYIHPFGSLITNNVSKDQLVKKLSVKDKDRLWLILRLGYSQEPTRSLRISVEDLLIN